MAMTDRVFMYEESVPLLAGLPVFSAIKQYRYRSSELVKRNSNRLDSRRKAVQKMQDASGSHRMRQRWDRR